jgi:hypothetical protein
MGCPCGHIQQRAFVVRNAREFVMLGDRNAGRRPALATCPSRRTMSPLWESRCNHQLSPLRRLPAQAQQAQQIPLFSGHRCKLDGRSHVLGGTFLDAHAGSCSLAAIGRRARAIAHVKAALHLNLKLNFPTSASEIKKPRLTGSGQTRLLRLRLLKPAKIHVATGTRPRANWDFTI